MESICIVDFCGSYQSQKHGYVYPYTYSADWFPTEKRVYFTGAWWFTPPMPADTEPTEIEVEEYAARFMSHDQFLDNYLFFPAI